MYSGCAIDLRAEIKVERKGIQYEPYETLTSLHSIFHRCHTLLGELTLPHDDAYILPLAKELGNGYDCTWPEALRLTQGLLRMRQVMPNNLSSPPSVRFWLTPLSMNLRAWLRRTSKILISSNIVWMTVTGLYWSTWMPISISCEDSTLKSMSRVASQVPEYLARWRVLKGNSARFRSGSPT